ncbi:MAG TPA: hypothetical protein VJM34_16195 [Novosphingobium sp.]|nr:hypothetical protein [Novosphingobium sp.]
MTGLGDAIKTIQGVLQLQFRVDHLDKGVEQLGGDMKDLMKDMASIDKRVVRIEAMIEMSSGRGSSLPAIEG